jgi:hypothetical protein
VFSCAVTRRNAPYAVRLLRRAVEAGDENAAASLGYAYDVDRCRRHLLKNLNGHAPCPQHLIPGRPVAPR